MGLRIMKKLLLLLFAAAIVIYFAFNLIVKTQIESQVYKHTGVPLKVGFVSLSPLSGTVNISGIAIPNPHGFSQFKNATSLENIMVSADLGSIFSGTIHIRTIKITKPEVFVEMKAGQNNLTALRNEVKKNAPPEAHKPAKQTKDEMKLTIDSLEINGAAIHLGSGVVPATKQTQDYNIPDIHLKNIGKSTGGADIANVTGVVIKKIQQAAGDIPRKIILSSLGDVSQQLLSLPVDTLLKAPDVLKQGAGKVGDVVKGSAGIAEDLMKGTAGTAGNVMKGGADALGKLLPFGGDSKASQ